MDMNEWLTMNACQEDLTCHRATKPSATTTETVLWSPRATASEPMCQNYWGLHARALQQEKPGQWENQAPQQRVASALRQPEKSLYSNEDPKQLLKKNKNKNKTQLHIQKTKCFSLLYFFMLLLDLKDCNKSFSASYITDNKYFLNYWVHLRK